jgi:hypothetical protein
MNICIYVSRSPIDVTSITSHRALSLGGETCNSGDEETSGPSEVQTPSDSLNADMLGMHNLLSMISIDRDRDGFEGVSVPQYGMACSIILSSYDKFKMSSSVLGLKAFVSALICLAHRADPSAPFEYKQMNGINEHPVKGMNKNLPEFEHESSPPVGLWSVWTTLHSVHPFPQYLELLTLNALLVSIDYKFFPTTFTSYEQLVEEPLVLFRLPIDVLRNSFVLRLVMFISQSALSASRCIYINIYMYIGSKMYIDSYIHTCL